MTDEATSYLDDDIIGPKEAAKLLGVSEKSVKNWLLAGKIPGTRFGKLWRLRKSALYKLIPTELSSSETSRKRS